MPGEPATGRRHEGRSYGSSPIRERIRRLGGLLQVERRLLVVICYKSFAFPRVSDALIKSQRKLNNIAPE